VTTAAGWRSRREAPRPEQDVRGLGGDVAEAVVGKRVRERAHSSGARRRGPGRAPVARGRCPDRVQAAPARQVQIQKRSVMAGSGAGLQKLNRARRGDKSLDLKIYGELSERNPEFLARFDRDEAKAEAVL